MDYDEETFLPLDITPLMYEPHPETECWEWKDVLYKNKFARYTVPGEGRKYLHRIIMENKHGPYSTEGKVVVWSCGNDHCINHEHMELKARHETRMTARVTLQEIAEIKGFIKIGASFDEILAKYNNRFSKWFLYKLRNEGMYKGIEPVYSQADDLIKKLKGKKDDPT